MCISWNWPICVDFTNFMNLWFSWMCDFMISLNLNCDSFAIDLEKYWYQKLNNIHLLLTLLSSHKYYKSCLTIELCQKLNCDEMCENVRKRKIVLNFVFMDSVLVHGVPLDVVHIWNFHPEAWMHSLTIRENFFVLLIELFGWVGKLIVKCTKTRESVNLNIKP